LVVVRKEKLLSHTPTEEQRQQPGFSNTYHPGAERAGWAGIFQNHMLINSSSWQIFAIAQLLGRS
jgi:hypothetical protein